MPYEGRVEITSNGDAGLYIGNNCLGVAAILLIRVLIETTPKKVLQRPDTSGSLVSWLIELSEFGFDYLLRHVTKG